MSVSAWDVVPDEEVEKLTPLHDLKDIEWYSGLNVWFALCVKGAWYYVPPPVLNKKRRREWFKFPKRPPAGKHQLFTYIHFPDLNLERLRVSGVEMQQSAPDSAPAAAAGSV